MARRSSRRPFARLLFDTGGNTLAIMAAALFPLAGMVGSAVDMSRLYLVRTRLQQACDAGVLAARRTMNAATLNADARTQAQNFFGANLRDGAYGATGITFAVADVRVGGNATGQVAGTAQATVPLSIMDMFGIAPVAMQATCEAELNVTNNDVMFVLDVTGSMACLPTDTEAQCEAYANNNANYTTDAAGRRWIIERPNSRIAGLRAAVQSFYTTLAGATSAEAQLRIGFVPYASAVNVAGILPANALRTINIPYQSRVANMDTPVHRRTGAGNWSRWGNPEQFPGGNISSTNCASYGNNVAFTQGSMTFNPGVEGNPSPQDEVIGGAQPTSQTEYRRLTATYIGDLPCQRERRTRPATYVTDRWTLTNFTHGPTNYTIGGSAIRMAEIIPPVTSRVNAPGAYNPIRLAQMQDAGTASGMTLNDRINSDCVEERADGMDDVTQIADTDDRRWARASPWLTYYRSGSAVENRTGNGQRPNDLNLQLDFCPPAAQTLAVMTQPQVNAYVNGPTFVPAGGTYHDVGMVWAARLMSPAGVFANNHAPPPNGRPVARHIIFMTDGAMRPNQIVYSAYGVEFNARRRVPTGTLNDDTLRNAHNTAFTNACAAARNPANANATIWVVAFGTVMTADMSACAGDATRTFTANTTQALNDQFQDIARRIAELRLSR